MLDLGIADQRPYVTSGIVFLGGEPGHRTLELMDRLRDRVDIDRSFLGGDETSYPFHYADQDLLNAILATRSSASGWSRSIPALSRQFPSRGSR